MKQIIISILISLALVGGVIALKPKSVEQINSVPFENVQIVEGKQIIELNVKGGYQPRKSVAKAGVPTILRFETSGNFDCSSAVRLPSLNISKFLPSTGKTDIDIGVPKTGIFYGTCSMGMYPFEIDFQN
jgi:plastocyanin domain-containing protein